jgi:enoyl-CoA hydratase
LNQSADIRFERRGPLGLVTLDRPQALNALTMEMCQAFTARLDAWSEDQGVEAVVVRGAGERAFCAGGDIRAIWDSGHGDGVLAARFFRTEYGLNRSVFTFPKPYLALIDGVTMGGGVGISVHGSHRIASEATLFAMPETGIGFFPDVGGSYFLPRLAGQLGLYLGLAGARLKAADCLYGGIATHYVERAKHDELIERLAEAPWSGDRGAVVEDALAGVAGNPGPAPLAEHRAAIDRCFAGASVEVVIEALRAEAGDWSERTLKALGRASPTSLKITLEQLRRGAALDFDGAIIMEYRLSQACLARHDVLEGIRAVVVDKDNTPRWDPPSLDQVSPELVEAHFAAPDGGDLSFGKVQL